MGASTNEEIPAVRFAVDRTGTTCARPKSEGATSVAGHPEAEWAPVAVGALLLYLFIIVAVMWGEAWLFVVAPALLVCLTRYMGLRSLWSSASRESSGLCLASLEDRERRDTYRFDRTEGSTRLPLNWWLWFGK